LGNYQFNMKQPIVGYHLDEEGVWVARLQCRHQQHIRHNPPLVSRPWVLTPEGREQFIGFELECKKCDEGAPRDW
jgi:hypothetical protein